MSNIARLANLIMKRNKIEVEISKITGRPASIDHLGEYIASRIFNIRLEDSADAEGVYGCFQSGGLKDHSVNIKWYPVRGGPLGMIADTLPDYYLVLIGPCSLADESVNSKARPWVIESIYLFNTDHLVASLRDREVQIGNTTGLPDQFWDKAELYPKQIDKTLRLSKDQRGQLEWFR
ncbi:MAG: hypothetical protein GY731_15675 [Gammaproteobacteria bacterium]|nr:hypothetical protein [Gammaproteobacteria bacterium]